MCDLVKRFVMLLRNHAGLNFDHLGPIGQARLHVEVGVVVWAKGFEKRVKPPYGVCGRPWANGFAKKGEPPYLLYAPCKVLLFPNCLAMQAG